MNLNDLATIVGFVLMVLATILVGGFAVACLAEMAVRKLQVAYWVAMYVLHRKEFHSWAKANASVTEKILLGIAEQEAGDNE